MKRYILGTLLACLLCGQAFGMRTPSITSRSDLEAAMKKASSREALDALWNANKFKYSAAKAIYDQQLKKLSGEELYRGGQPSGTGPSGSGPGYSGGQTGQQTTFDFEKNFENAQGVLAGKNDSEELLKFAANYDQMFKSKNLLRGQSNQWVALLGQYKRKIEQTRVDELAQNEKKLRAAQDIKEAEEISGSITQYADQVAKYERQIGLEPFKNTKRYSELIAVGENIINNLAEKKLNLPPTEKPSTAPTAPSTGPATVDIDVVLKAAEDVKNAGGQVYNALKAAKDAKTLDEAQVKKIVDAMGFEATDDRIPSGWKY